MTVIYQSGGAQKAFNTSTAVAVPAGVTAGDVVLIAVSGTVAGQTFTWPSGFVQKAVSTQGAVTVAVAWKRATGADSGNYTVTPSSGQFSAQAHRVSGCITTGDPFRQTPDCEGGQPSEPNTSLTGVPAGDLLVHLVGTNNTTKPIVIPAGYTDRTAGGGFNTSTKAQTVTGDTGTVNGGTTTAFNPFAAMLFSLMPAPPPTRFVNVGGVAVAATRKVNVGGVTTSVTRKIKSG
jgi:hypothetical protein